MYTKKNTSNSWELFCGVSLLSVHQFILSVMQVKLIPINKVKNVHSVSLQTFNLQRICLIYKEIIVAIFSEKFVAMCMYSDCIIKHDANVSLERFSNECRKTKTKVITLANQKGRRQSSKPIKTRSN